jgi:hypothetical protein
VRAPDLELEEVEVAADEGAGPALYAPPLGEPAVTRASMSGGSEKRKKGEMGAMGEVRDWILDTGEGRHSSWCYIYN